MVALGGSAGALEVFSAVLAAVPENTRVAIIVAQHLSATHESLLVDLLGRVAKLPVQWAHDGAVCRPGHVYVVPPKSAMILREGRFAVDAGGPSMSQGSIDHMLRALATEARHRAVGILCSGNGSDGVQGLKAIKEAGGMAFAQREETAAFPTMPRAALHAGCLDGVLTPTEIATAIAQWAQHTSASWHRQYSAALDEPEWEAGALRTVFRLLTARRGLDFTHYKPTTIKRRLLRRMLITQTAGLPAYVELVQKTPAELDALYENLLINVTEFFRDPAVFDYLGEHVLRRLIGTLAPDVPLRIWVPGCSTGEEPYSLCMLVREVLEQLGRSQPVQVFGTDMSDRAIAAARAGVFSAADVATLSPARVARYFEQRNNAFVIQKAIRDMCVFARQNVVADAPFSRLHLVSCRNLLIYLDPQLQRKVLPVFHYALNPDGVLMLGPSESIGTFPDLFRPVDRRFRIYTRRTSGRRTLFEFSSALPDSPAPPPVSPPRTMPETPREPYELIREADRVVLERHSPPGVLLSADLDILQFRGDVSFYLTPHSGRASLNVISMAREGFAGELQAGLDEVRQKGVPLRKANVTVAHKDEIRRIGLEIFPVETPVGQQRGFLVLFVEPAPGAPEVAFVAPLRTADNTALLAQIDQLKQELQIARRHLHALLEKHEAADQEARVASEEVQSSNEELQSTNEELETAKEELQSTNEELTTVNQELHSRHLELIQVNNDLVNLINSVQLPIVILSEDLRIRRFTPSAETVLNLIPSDLGRPLSDINIKLNLPHLTRQVSDVMRTLTLTETEVQDAGGRWHSIRIRPYKTTDNKIEGAVVSIIDIDQMKRAIALAEDARDISEAVLETSSEPVVVLDDKLSIRSANAAFYRLFAAPREQLNGKLFLELLKAPDEIARIRRALLDILPEQSMLNDVTVHLDASTPEAKEMILNARQISRAGQRFPLILVSLHRPDGAPG